MQVIFVVRFVLNHEDRVMMLLATEKLGVNDMYQAVLSQAAHMHSKQVIKPMSGVYCQVPILLKCPRRNV